MTYDGVVAGLRAATRELETERRLVRAGLKQEQETAAIVERYAWLYSEEALAAAEAAPGEEGQRVRAALLSGIVERRTASRQDRLASFYASARVQLEGEELPFYTALARIAQEDDPDRREALGEATHRVMEEADELALEVNAAVGAVLRELGYQSYTAFWSELKQVDYTPLLEQLSRLADQLAGPYRAWVEPRMQLCGHGFGDTPQLHMAYLRALPEHRHAYARERFEAAMRATFEGLGLDLFGSPTIQLDLEDRPAKNPRASVMVPEAGREVHLLVRPGGGSHDYAAFLHEAGHALHFGLTDPALGWPLANLPRSMAYPELWSFLIEGIGRQPGWIAATTGVDAATAERMAADQVGVSLMLFMRYVGKLAYELELYSGDSLDRDRGRRLYADIPSARTGFRYDARAWQHDRDAGLYAADYLRVWLAEAELEWLLREWFGERWWASRATGAWLREHWRRGCTPELEDFITQLGGRARSGQALLERVRRCLPEAA